MARIPSYGKKQPKNVTTAMLWDAPEKAEQKKVEEAARQERIFYREDPEEEAKKQRDAIKREHIKQAQAARNKYRCSFCGNEDREHECLEYKRMLKQYSDNVNRTIRPGVPLAWAKEHYAAKGLPLPLPEDMYD
jgi:hypothetical protein